MSARPAPPRGVAGLTAAITVTGITANTLISAAIPDILDDLGTGPAGAGALLAAATAPGILLAPLIGLLADRYGRREVVVPCLLVFGLSGGLASFAPNFGTLLVLRFLQGMGSAGLVNLAVVIIADHWEGPERARMIGRNAAALTASIAVLPPVGGLLTSLGGWRLTFVPYWLALVTAAAVARRLAPAGPRDASTLAAQLRAAGPVLGARSMVGAMGLGFAMFLLVFGCFLTVVPVYLADEFGLQAGLRGVVLGLPALGSTTAALAAGRVRARFPVRRVLAGGTALLAAAFVLLAAAPNLVLLCAAVVVYGLGEGLMIPALQDSVSGAAPAASRGAVIATFVGVARAGQTAGPMLAGPGLAGWGPRPVLGLGAAFAAVLLLAIVAEGPGESLPSVAARAPEGGGPDST